MPNGSDSNLATMWETQAQSLGQEDPLDEGRAAQSSVLAGESRGQRSLGGGGATVGGVAESDRTNIFTFHPGPKAHLPLRAHFPTEVTRTRKKTQKLHNNFPNQRASPLRGGERCMSFICSSKGTERGTPNSYWAVLHIPYQ